MPHLLAPLEPTASDTTTASPLDLWTQPNMDHLECPTPSVWSARRIWFAQEEEGARGKGSYLVSEQACALLAELQSVFCAGAWVAVIVLAVAVVEAQLRDIEFSDFRGNLKQLLDAAGTDPDLQQLRARRNALVHCRPDAPGITVDDQWARRAELEDQAREAIRLALAAFYMSPGT